MTLRSTGSTVGSGSITSTGTVIVSQKSATALTMNAASAGSGNINGTVSDASGTVEISNGGSGGVVLAGGTAVTATSIGINAGTATITASAAGSGGLSAANILLQASCGDRSSRCHSYNYKQRRYDFTSANASGAAAQVAMNDSAAHST